VQAGRRRNAGAAFPEAVPSRISLSLIRAAHRLPWRPMPVRGRMAAEHVREKVGMSDSPEAPAAPQQFETLHEIIRKARQNLNQNDWDYVVGGAESETTLRRNRLALDSIAFRPRVLRDVSQVDTSVEQLGRRLRLPVILAPIGALEI